MPRVLIVDPDSSFRESLFESLRKEGQEVEGIEDGGTALEAIAKGDWDLLLCEVDLPGAKGLELLHRTQDLSPRTLILVVSSSPSLETAVEAIRYGAQDYLLKPISTKEVVDRILQLIEHRYHAEEVQFLRRRIPRTYDFVGIIGKSKALERVLNVVKKVAPTQATILISGDSGTGKELIARAIHSNSDRKDKLFLPVNCGALPDTLLESLLFGHMKGAFTGAFANQEGLFEKARGGTIFLDEIGEIPQLLQVKLLRALEAFREDLYYRLNVMEIHIPSLAERPEDIPLLVDHLIQKHNPALKKNFKGAEGAVIRLLMSQPWKGNVRELDNVIEHTMILADGEWITVENLPLSHIRRVLDEASDDRKEGARLLGISLSSLYRKIDELGVT
jgi:DNA-binding NtrC family response regulator